MTISINTLPENGDIYSPAGSAADAYATIETNGGGGGPGLLMVDGGNHRQFGAEQQQANGTMGGGGSGQVWGILNFAKNKQHLCPKCV